MENVPKTLLSHQWHFVNTAGIFIYVVMIIALINENDRDSFSPCEMSLSHWINRYHDMMTGASAAAIMLQSVNIILQAFKNFRSDTMSAYLTAFTIMMISFSAEVMNISGNFPLRKNNYGIVSSSLQFCEWQVTVPIMIYLCLTLDCRKTHLSKSDFVAIFLSWFGPFCLYLEIFEGLYKFRHIILLTGIISMSIVLFIVLRTALTSQKTLASINKNDPSEIISEAVLDRQIMCCIFILLSFPLFPTAFFSAIFGLIDNTQLSLANGILNFATKALFSAILMYGHLECLNPTRFQYLAEKRANDARRVFLRYVFHEVRSPLNSMTLGVHVLQSYPELMINSDCKDTLDLIREASLYTNEILNEVLYMQKIDEGELALERQPFKTEDLIVSAVREYTATMEQKKIKLVAVIENNVPTEFLGDFGRIREVIGKLVCNAVKFSNTVDDVHLKLSFDESTSSLNCTVIDNGVGISLEDEKLLFIPYIKLRPGEIKPGRGAGVSLAICKEIITHHGGTVGFKRHSSSSTKPGSSEFFFNLPMKVVSRGKIVQPISVFGHIPEEVVNQTTPDVHVESVVESNHKEVHPVAVSEESVVGMKTRSSIKRIEERSQLSVPDAVPIPRTTTPSATAGNIHGPSSDTSNSSSHPKESDPSASTESSSAATKIRVASSLNVLIVDDVLSNRKMLMMLLKKKGIESKMAEDGVEAINILLKKENNFDLVFMDNMMPNMCGIECTQKFRESGFDKLIFGLTGNTLDVEVEDFLNAGANIVLPKPLQIAQLDKLLRICETNGTLSEDFNNVKILHELSGL